MHRIFVRLGLFFVLLALAGGATLASATAAEITLRDVLRSGDAVAACGTNDRLLATFKFVKSELGSPDKCTVYRFIARDDVQRKCFGAIVTAAGQNQASFLKSLDIPEAGTPAFCTGGCNCNDTISYRSIQ
jgi:hypothetical protein